MVTVLFSPRYTMNEKWIAQQQEKHDNGELEYDSIGCDGDGFHFDTLEVPDECTLNSLGISLGLCGVMVMKAISPE